MKAALLYAPGDLRIEEVPDPQPGPGEVLIRIRACGVCPSDVRAFTGERGGKAYPRFLGHEWAGEILALGPEVEGWKVGDRVVPEWRTICGYCYYCRRGIFNYCTRVRGIRGGFCELGVAPAPNLRLIPENLSFEEAAFSEPLACCINGSEALNLRLGDDVVVIGCGPIGLKHIQLARAQGAIVIACDLIPERRQKALELGAHFALDPQGEDPINRVKDLTEGRGANAVLIAIGNPQAIQMGIEMAGINARINLFAGTYPPAEIPLDPNKVHYRQLFITGTHDYTPHHFSTAVKLLQHQIVKVNPLISHRFSLEETEQAFNLSRERKGLKAMVLMEG